MISIIKIGILLLCAYWSQANEYQITSDILSVHFNKSCLNDDECHDFRMICSNEVCLCSRFYKWEEDEQECIQQLEVLKEFLANLKEERDIEGDINRDAHRSFFFFALSGILTATLGLLGVFACICVLCLTRLMEQDENEHALIEEKRKKMIKDGDGGIADVAATTFRSVV